MPTYTLSPGVDGEGVPVEFPHEAYDCQLVYMERVLQALTLGDNALLESPTGTGKTLCLLCSALAWHRRLKERAQPGTRPPLIIYASRTHSQLKQVIGELKATSYRPKMTVLSSRAQACVHKDVSELSGGAQNAACSSLVQASACRHHHAVENYIKAHPQLGNEEVVDIEDLVTSSKQVGRAGPCPYYLTRELLRDVELIFVPYNFLVDVKMRETLGPIPWHQTVVLFDEAHNLESVCSENASFELPAAHLSACISEAGKVWELVATEEERHGGPSPALEEETDPLRKRAAVDYKVLKGALVTLEEAVSKLPYQREGGYTGKGDFVLELLEQVGINDEGYKLFSAVLKDAVAVLAGEAAAGGATRGARDGNFRLSNLVDGLDTIFRAKNGNALDCYRTHVFAEQPRGSEQQQQQQQQQQLGGGRGRQDAVAGPTLGFWCFIPGVNLCRLQTEKMIRSIILTSGTLSPMASFATELRLSFDVRLENPHVINPSQVWIGVLPTGPASQRLNSSYQSRDRPEYKRDLGHTLVNLARLVPDGLLVFFPSYGVMQSCVDYWQRPSPDGGESIWDRISRNKFPVVEPREASSFPAAQAEFRAKLDDPALTGAAFFAVCRGKVSEGLDFSDRAGRAVVLTGIPFSMSKDPRVRLKRAYLDEHRAQTGGLSGQQWYTQSAMRAVNQAVGRVIRHRHDFGAIILADERFATESIREQLSLWLRPRVVKHAHFGQMIQSLTQFFKAQAAAAPAAARQPVQPPAPPPAWHAPASRAGAGDRANVRAFAGGAGVGAAHAAAPPGGLLARLQAQASVGATGAPHRPAARGSSLAEILSASRAAQPAPQPPPAVRRQEAPGPAPVPQAAPAPAPERPRAVPGTKGAAALDRVLRRPREAPQCRDAGNRPPAQLGPKEFNAEVQAFLEQDDYHDFKLLLRGFKAHELPVEALLDGVAAQLATRWDLFSAFGTFVPADHRDKFEQRLRAGPGRPQKRDRAALEAGGAQPLGKNGASERPCCAQCKGGLEQPYRSPCGHVACYACWIDVMRQGGAPCPTCGEHVRKKHLKQEFLV